MAAATIDTTTAFLDDRAETYVDSDENRQVKVRLHKDAAREYIELKWHGGARHKPSPSIRLKKNMTVVVPVKKARAWFGYFTIPHDAENERDEARVRDLRALYHVETERTKLAWGDYPRPRKLSDGTDPIGPHRFPDVEVNVTEWDGQEWGWIRLHKLYNLGIFDPQQFVDKAADDLAAKEAENKVLRARLTEMDGKISQLTDLTARLTRVPAEKH
jgi:hypothetical protein